MFELVKHESRIQIMTERKRKLLVPENRVDTQLVGFMNQDDQVMAQYLTKRFVDHGSIGLAAQRVAELALHHAERGLHIGALVVVLQELLFTKHKVVEHLLKSPARLARRCTLERDKRGASALGRSKGQSPYDFESCSPIGSALRFLIFILCVFASSAESVG